MGTTNLQIGIVYLFLQQFEKCVLIFHTDVFVDVSLVSKIRKVCSIFASFCIQIVEDSSKRQYNYLDTIGNFNFRFIIVAFFQYQFLTRKKQTELSEFAEFTLCIREEGRNQGRIQREGAGSAHNTPSPPQCVCKVANQLRTLTTLNKGNCILYCNCRMHKPTKRQFAK